MLFSPHGFSLDYWKIPLIQKKKRQTHNITSANKRWEFPQNSLCQEKLRVSSTLLHSKTGLEKLGLTSRALDAPESVTTITQTQYCQTQSLTSVNICSQIAYLHLL